MKVLFVCVENSCRSQMAEAWFNALSRKGRASSAGTNPAYEVDPLAVKVMDEVGISMAGRKPKVLTPEIADDFDVIVTMGCGSARALCPNFPGKTIEWSIEDPKGKGLEKYREVREEIRKKVEELIKSFES